jgi:hypothetical protein
MKGEAIEMAQLPSWTSEVSERLMDIQLAAERGDQRILTLIHDTQAFVEEVEDTINGVFTTVRTGKMPRRMQRATNDTPEAA